MPILQHIEWTYSLAGLLVGGLVGLTGVGGGAFMTPLLVLLFGVAPATAVGTDLLFACVTKCTGVTVHGLNKTVDWKVVRHLAIGSVPMTVLTLVGLAYFGTNGHRPHDAVTSVLGIALVLTAVALVFRQKILARMAPRLESLDDPQRQTLTIVLGAILGFFVSISSVGAGAIGVTALLLLYPKLPIVRIVGSDIAHAVPLTFVAGAGHWYLGTVDLAILGSLLVGSIPGIVLSSYLSNRMSERILRPILAATLTVVGVRLVF